MTGVEHEGAKFLYSRLLTSSDVENWDTTAETAESGFKCLWLFYRLLVT
jgi:hypothetical protein